MLSNSIISGRDLSVTTSELHAHGADVLLRGTPEARRELFEYVRRRPIILLDDYPPEDDAAIILGPARLIKAMSRFLLQDTVEHYGTRLGDAASRRGLAFERYIEEAVAGTDVKRLSPDGRKTPDFEWTGTRYRILVEAKVKPLPAEIIASPRSLVTAWDNLMEAVEQASDYAARFRDRGPGKCVLIILVNDAYADEQTSFRHVTASWGLLDQTPLSAIAVLSPGDFEHLVMSSTADDAGHMLERLWRDAGQRSPLDQPPTVDKYRVETVPHVLDEAHRMLFGCGFNDLREPERDP